jgi:hypothetical protein
MKIRIMSLLLATLAMSAVWQSADGQHLLKHRPAGPPACEPGFKIVEEVVVQDVVRHVCKYVTEYKKKWVYSTIDDPFCVQHGKHGSCEKCAGPFCRKLLVKREVDDLQFPATKCVTEAIVEKVAVTVYRKVPCDTPNHIEMIPVKPTPIPAGK